MDACDSGGYCEMVNFADFIASLKIGLLYILPSNFSAFGFKNQQVMSQGKNKIGRYNLNMSRILPTINY